ncbi:Peptidase family M23 [Sphingomonas gellani]|uniref:Peptidase family M23 n=1 Tax=Sphingomonas gellani TaxID=1166340 RepID=A0A1H8ER85_9SPHN|nr:M23 family metallopeptidase [Sphingomonas gellani]SEN21995.1 Peptidase family M23 [Sphingomonas gellani]
MTRVGWIMLALVLLVVAGFASTVRFGGPSATRFRMSRAAPAVEGVSPGMLTIPVRGVRPSQIADSWGDARGDGTREHHGTDIMAAAGTPVLAVMPGRVEKLFASRLGGTTLYLRSADRRWIYYYAHLSGYAPGVSEGQVVRAGEPLGYVGDTGNAGAGNYHLHFGVQRMLPTQHWWEGQDVNPYPLLAGRAAQR